MQVNIAIMRAFVKLREFTAIHKELAKKLRAMEKKFEKHDKQFVVVFQAIKQLMDSPPELPRTRIRGFSKE